LLRVLHQGSEIVNLNLNNILSQTQQKQRQNSASLSAAYKDTQGVASKERLIFQSSTSSKRST